MEKHIRLFFLLGHGKEDADAAAEDYLQERIGDSQVTKYLGTFDCSKEDFVNDIAMLKEWLEPYTIEFSNYATWGPKALRILIDSAFFGGEFDREAAGDLSRAMHLVSRGLLKFKHGEQWELNWRFPEPLNEDRMDETGITFIDIIRGQNDPQQNILYNLTKPTTNEEGDVIRWHCVAYQIIS